MPNISSFLPEPKWLFRRLMIFATILFIGAMLAYIAHVLAVAGATAALLTLALALIIQATVLQLIYLVAPSAEYLSGIARVIDAAIDGKVDDAPTPPAQNAP